MEDKKILNQILENTQEVKKAVIKEKAEARDNAQLKALKKFKRVGTQLNEEEQERFNAILEAENTNANAYIKKLIFGDNKGSSKQDEECINIFVNQIEELSSISFNLEQENKKLNSEIVELKSELKKKEETIANKENEIVELNEEIAEIEELGLMGILKLWFYSVKPWGK